MEDITLVIALGIIMASVVVPISTIALLKVGSVGIKTQN